MVSEMSCEFIFDQERALVTLHGMKRTPWDALSSAELAGLLGVSLQVLANWRVRGRGPSWVKTNVFRGTRTFYAVAEIDRWLRALKDDHHPLWEIVAAWLGDRFFFPSPLETEERTWRVVNQLSGWGIFPLTHKPHTANHCLTW